MAIQGLRRTLRHCEVILGNPVPLKRRFLSSCLWGCVLAVQAVAGSARAAEPPSQQCPDLAGTYAVGQTAWIDTLHLKVTGTVRPKGQAPQLATMRRAMAATP